RQVGQVAGIQRFQVGIQDGGRGALVLSKFGEDFVTHGDGKVAEGLADHSLVARSQEGEEQANRHRFRLSGTYLLGNSAGLPLRQRPQWASSRVDPLA